MRLVEILIFLLMIFPQYKPQSLQSNLDFSFKSFKPKLDIKSFLPKIPKHIRLHLAAAFPQKDFQTYSKLVIMPKANKKPGMCKICGEIDGKGFHKKFVVCDSCFKFFSVLNRYEINYIPNCVEGGNCVINEENRSKCQYCRLKKCADIGMTPEDHLLKTMERGGMKFINQIIYLNQNIVNRSNTSKSSTGMWSNESFYELTDRQAVLNDMYVKMSHVNCDRNLKLEILSGAISEAFINADLFRKKYVCNKFSMPQDLSEIVSFQTISYENLWMECSLKLTDLTLSFLQFLNNIPVYKLIPRNINDSIVKSSFFGLAILAMSRHYDLSKDCVLFGNILLSEVSFYSKSCLEREFVSLVFSIAKEIAILNLTDNEFALYSAAILFHIDYKELSGYLFLNGFSNAIAEMLHLEIYKRDSIPHYCKFKIYHTLMTKIPILINMGSNYSKILTLFLRSHNHIKFSPIHNEVFLKF